MTNKRVAMFLSGCGFLDGAEVNESIFSILALRQAGIEIDFFAPQKNQLHVVDHQSGNEASETRNALTEAARITRGNVMPLEKCEPGNYGALVFPGGYGVAKNFCTFAVDGLDAKIDQDIHRCISHFLNDESKAILAICISPALVGLVAAKLDKKLTLSLGTTDDDAAKAMQSLGHEIVATHAGEFCLDVNNRVISTPAFMCDIGMEEAWPGIRGAVAALQDYL